MLGEVARERDLERALLEHLRKFLIELGIGFAFVGSQYPLAVGGEEFRIDLLFYHLRFALPRSSRPGRSLPARVRRQNEFLSVGGQQPVASF